MSIKSATEILQTSFSWTQTQKSLSIKSATEILQTSFRWTQTKKIAEELELELELIQPHMAQKPVLRGEVGCACVAREVSVERGGMGERGCARRLGGWVWV